MMQSCGRRLGRICRYIFLLSLTDVYNYNYIQYKPYVHVFIILKFGIRMEESKDEYVLNAAAKWLAEMRYCLHAFAQHNSSPAHFLSRTAA